MNGLARILRPYIHVLIKLIYRFYFNLSVNRNFEKKQYENKKNEITHGEQYIFCSNHSSHLDALAIICSSGIPVDQFVVIAAKDYFFQSTLQQFLVQLLMEIVPIHRDPTLDQMRENVKMLEEQIHNKKNLILFPEGTRTPDGTIQPFKPGLGYIAKKLALPIVPVFIHGTNTCLPKGKSFPNPGKISVTFTQALHCEDHWKSFKNQALSDLVYQQIAAMSVSKHNTVQPPVELSILTTNDPQDDFVKQNMNMTINHDIQGIALITGASSGIGKAIAIALAKKGYDLVLVGRNESELEQTAEDCKIVHPCNAITYAVDLSNLDAVHKMIAWLEQSKFEIEVLVNNAGFGLMSSFINSDLNTELDMINVHINTPLILMKYVLPKMAKRNIGFIMNVSSIYAFGSVPFQSVYGATKSFLNSFSFALREELRHSGISVTTVCPGSTSTRFRRFLRSETEAAKGMDASIVAQQACKDLFARKVVSIAGRINQFYFYILWIFPATSLAGIVRKINHKRGMNQSSTY